jgi:hypothetical protein
LVRVSGIAGVVISQYALIASVGLSLLLYQIAVWQSLSERWGICHNSREGLEIIAALGLSGEDKHVRGKGTRTQVPLFQGGS